MTHRYKVKKVVSDNRIKFNSENQDEDLLDAWGIAIENKENDNSRKWVASYGFGTVIGYDTVHECQLNAVRVDVPDPLNARTNGGRPTGVIVNESNGFIVSDSDGDKNSRSKLIICTEDGTICAYSPLINQRNAIIQINNHHNGSVYKGIAQINDHIYVADFHHRRIEVFDYNFNLVNKIRNCPEGYSTTFEDGGSPSVPNDYAPFNIVNIHDKLYVTYAKRNRSDKRYDLPGAGNGYINIFDHDGKFIKRFASRGSLNSPWGIVYVKDSCSLQGDKIFVSNSGDGIISVFTTDGEYIGSIDDCCNKTVRITGIKGLAQECDKIYFSAGFRNLDSCERLCDRPNNIPIIERETSDVRILNDELGNRNLRDSNLRERERELRDRERNLRNINNNTERRFRAEGRNILTDQFELDQERLLDTVADPALRDPAAFGLTNRFDGLVSDPTLRDRINGARGFIPDGEFINRDDIIEENGLLLNGSIMDRFSTRERAILERILAGDRNFNSLSRSERNLIDRFTPEERETLLNRRELLRDRRTLLNGRIGILNANLARLVDRPGINGRIARISERVGNEVLNTTVDRVGNEAVFQTVATAVISVPETCVAERPPIRLLHGLLGYIKKCECPKPDLCFNREKSCESSISSKDSCMSSKSSAESLCCIPRCKPIDQCNKCNRVKSDASTCCVPKCNPVDPCAGCNPFVYSNDSFKPRRTIRNSRKF